MAEIDEFGMFANAFHKMRIPGQNIIMGLLVLITAGSLVLRRIIGTRSVTATLVLSGE